MTRHLLPLRSDAEKRRAQDWLSRAPTGKGWRVAFLPPVRRDTQSAYMWALLDDIAAQMEWAGKKRSADDWKALFSASLRGQELVPNLDNDGFVAFGARTSEFSPEEMSDMIELIRSWGAGHGVTFTDPETIAGHPPGDERGDGPRGKGAPSPRNDFDADGGE